MKLENHQVSSMTSTPMIQVKQRGKILPQLRAKVVVYTIQKTTESQRI